MIGDNLSYSIDSRHFGPIPEKNIIGKAELVLFNYKNGKFRCDRFLKRIETVYLEPKPMEMVTQKSYE